MNKLFLYFAMTLLALNISAANFKNQYEYILSFDSQINEKELSSLIKSKSLVSIKDLKQNRFLVIFNHEIKKEELKKIFKKKKLYPQIQPNFTYTAD